MGGLIVARVWGREVDSHHAMPHTHLPNHQSAFIPCASFPSLPCLPPFPHSFSISIHFSFHFHIADWREREPFIFTPNQTRFVPIFPFFLFLFSIISTPQSPHFQPLSLLSFFPSFLPSFSSPRWHHHPHRVTIPANNQSRLDARTPSAPIVELSTKPTTPLDATNAPSPWNVQPMDVMVSHPIDG